MYIKTPGSIPIKIQEYTVYIPKMPDKQLIHGYELPKKDQRWMRTGLPAFWDERRLEEEYTQEKEMEMVLNGDIKKVTHFDPQLEAFRKREWKRRIYGFWLYINGVPTYFTGAHYMYLQWSKGDHSENNGYPVFYSPQIERFYFKELCKTDPFCLGYIVIGGRGFGKTAEEVSICLEDMTKAPYNRKMAIQSKSWEDAQKVIFKEKMVLMFNSYPDFFKPTYSHGEDPEKKMTFNKKRTAEDRFKEELGNTIYPRSAKEKALDGGTYANILNDEIGKCLKIDTPILMYNGDIKLVQDVVKGDLLMGDDSTPRKVLGLGRGQEMMYDIIPNKGMEWGCNESHILSLKWCWQQSTNINGDRVNKYDVVNITVKDYLQLKPTQQKSLMLYKVPIEYKSKSHVLDPYFLGLWLGDGKSNKMSIFNMEPEIDDYLKFFASYNNLILNKTPGNSTTNNFYRYSFNRSFLSSYLLNTLNLKNNKHIPLDYLIDSKTNRLNLLAGIIDTDGSINKKGNRVNYEITQKNKQLALDIQRIASSLGFGASLKKRISKMKRKDGSIYQCETHRITIFGDLHKIPCLVQRKIAPVIENHHKNRRNPLHTGFKVIKKQIDNYYGFSIDGNRLFVLGDHTVTHNTDPKKEANVAIRAEVNIKCVYRNNKKVGLYRNTTTVEEMDKGGAECEVIWKESNPKTDFRDGNGYTVSKLYRWFVNAVETKTQFADHFGIIDKEKALKFIDNERARVKNDTAKLSSIMRKDPLTPAEAFIRPANKSLFQPFIITKRMDELSRLSKLPGRRGNLYWSQGFGSDVFFNDDPDGLFRVFYHPDNKEGFDDARQDRKILNAVKKQYNEVKMKWEYIPVNNDLFGGGCDPIKTKRTFDPRASKLACWGFKKFDPLIDDPNEMRGWSSHNFAWKYNHRSDNPEDDYDNIVKALFYFGHSIMPEGNVTDLTKHIRGLGMDPFLIVRKDFDETVFEKNKRSKTNQDEPVDTYDEVLNTIVSRLQAFVVKHGHRIDDYEFLEQLKDFDAKNPTKFDLVIAAGYTLISLDSQIYYDRFNGEDLSKAENAFPTFNINGHESKIITSFDNEGDEVMLPEDYINEILNRI